MNYLFLLLFASSCTSSTIYREYSLNKYNIEEYRNSEIKENDLLEIIHSNSQFINLDDNPFIAGAVLEHHLIETIDSRENKTHLVFEYFFFEGASSRIFAVTTNKKGEMTSVIRLAQYTEYPDGNLSEYSKIQNDTLRRVQIVEGLQSYNDSLEEFTFRRDSTLVVCKLGNFNHVEKLDSVFVHSEYKEIIN